MDVFVLGNLGACNSFFGKSYGLVRLSPTMLMSLAPLRNNREYRLLFLGQMVSFLGSMITYVAVPYQVYELTKDNALVGMVSIAALVSVFAFGVLGGTYADRLNRRRLLLVSEVLLGFSVIGLMVNASLERPSVPTIFILIAIKQAIAGFHRPAMEALSQSIVDKKDYAAIGALGSLRYSIGAILGPMLGGLLLAGFGVQGAFFVDLLTYVIAFISLALMKQLPKPAPSTKSPWTDAKEGVSFALSKPVLIGTYVTDIVAMVFAFPVALFPAMSQNWGGPKVVGLLFSAMAIGSLLVTLFSGWTSKVYHHGRGVIFSAALWGAFMMGVGFSNNLWLCVFFLILAGGADMLSGLFRSVIWNETVPNALRGRLSGIEMISYMTGPLLGNGRAGWVAAKYSVTTSLISGGVICFLAVLITAKCLPQFWRYRSEIKT